MALVYSLKKSGEIRFFTTMNFNIWSVSLVFQGSYLSKSYIVWLSINFPFYNFSFIQANPGYYPKMLEFFYSIFEFFAITDVINDIINGNMMKLLPSQTMSLMTSLMTLLGGTI